MMPKSKPRVRPRTSTGSVLAALLFLASCTDAGGGCGGCGTDSVLQPIPGGYPTAARIENAAQVRITSSGLDFLESNVNPLIDFAFPEGLDFAFTKQVVYDPPLVPAITMCDDDDCSAHIEVKGIGLTPKSPNRIEATLKLLVESRDASGPPGQKKTWDGTCDLNVDTTKGTRNYIGVKAEIALEAETQPARQGYTYARIVSIGEDPAEKIEAADLAVSGGFIGACSLLNFDTLKGWILNLVLDPVTDMLTGVLDDQLCTTPGLHGCPQGTFAVGAGEEAVCRYSNSESARCVPLLLGYEGQGNLGASLLGGFSPGTDGSAQFVVASGGAAEAVSQGLSLFFYGGLRSMDPTLTSSPAHASCVPTRPVPPIPTVPRAATFRGNVLPGSNTTTHVGIGISEQFLNYASYGLYDSGMLCLGVGTRVSQQISAGLFSLLLQSLKNLTFPENNAPLSIVLRPSQEPSFEVGKGTDSDPLLLMTLKGVSADFYLFTQERYVRFMTFSGDLHVSLNLEVQGSELTIAIGGVTTENASVTNSELLAEDPGVLSGLIEDVLTSFASQLASTIPPITLPSFAGFSLDVPDNGVTGVEDTGEEFVAIFANLMLDPNAVTSLAETDATLVRLDADADSLRLENLGKSAPPTAWIDASATGRLDAAFEYSYRVDGGAWSRWQADPRLAVSDRRLELQATHRVEVRSRVAGEPRTTDLTPAALDVVVDVLPPVVHAARRDDTVLITAWDAVTGADGLEFRVVSGDAPSVWASLGAQGASVPAPFDDSSIAIEVRDGSGNVGRTTAALIRGIPKPGDTTACDCHVPGGRHGSPLGVLLGLGLAVVALRRRLPIRGMDWRRLVRWTGVLTLLLAFTTLAGCSCDDEKKAPCGGTCGVAPEPSKSIGDICCPSENMCVPYDLESFCEGGYICAEDALALDDTCALSCSKCVVKPALGQGEIGTHLSVVQAGDGSLVASGYSAGDPPGRPYGDLVVTRIDTNAIAQGGSGVDWTILDGAPTSPITNDPAGWRGGVSNPGDDVGRYTAIVENAGMYHIAYYDRTNGALKMASGSPGGSWAIHVVDDTDDSGRHASMVLGVDGAPIVAYMRVGTDGSGHTTGSVVVATAITTTPASTADWSFAIVASKELPCRAAACATGTVCLESGECAAPTDDCASACKNTEACVLGECQTTIGANFVEDWAPAIGYYASLARTPTGLALTYYDRTNGTLYGARYDGAAWGTPFTIDGYESGVDGAGDSGIGSSLFVDQNDVWHIAYADGSSESLKYARIDGLVVTRSVVDDGTGDGTQTFSDGRHVVGDDTAIVVTADGGVRIVYQDASAHQTRIAALVNGADVWSRSVLSSPGSHEGFWLNQLVTGNDTLVIGWWRGNGNSKDNGLRVSSVGLP